MLFQSRSIKSNFRYYDVISEWIYIKIIFWLSKSLYKWISMVDFNQRLTAKKPYLCHVINYGISNSSENEFSEQTSKYFWGSFLVKIHTWLRLYWGDDEKYVDELMSPKSPPVKNRTDHFFINLSNIAVFFVMLS